MSRKALSLVLSALILLGLMCGCGQSSTTQAPAETAAPEPTAAPAPTDAPVEETAAPAAETSAPNVASAEDMTTVEDVVEEGMKPVRAENIIDGVYPVEMKSSSSMFKADHCELTVENGKMYVTLFMTSEAYPFMFSGTALEAAQAEEDKYIPLTEGDGDFNTFTLEIDALDEGLPFAAFSKRKNLWYDRTLLFRADSIPMDAFAEGYLTTPESLGLADGEYTVAVTLSGGSGKASVSSPAKLTVSGGEYTAEIIWSSSKYDYVRIGEEKYLPVNTQGNSTFLLPVKAFDYKMPIVADTKAMSTPHEVSYALYFDSGSIQPVG